MASVREIRYCDIAIFSVHQEIIFKYWCSRECRSEHFQDMMTQYIAVPHCIHTNDAQTAPPSNNTRGDLPERRLRTRLGHVYLYKCMRKSAPILNICILLIIIAHAMCFQGETPWLPCRDSRWQHVTQEYAQIFLPARGRTCVLAFVCRYAGWCWCECLRTDSKLGLFWILKFVCCRWCRERLLCCLDCRPTRLLCPACARGHIRMQAA